MTDPSRFHFTNDAPVTVQTSDGSVEIGAGWLAISEAEYAALLRLQRPTQDDYRAAGREMLSARIGPDAYDNANSSDRSHWNWLGQMAIDSFVAKINGTT